VGDLPAPNADYPQWRMTLLDTAHRLPPGYVPPDLTPTAPAGLAGPFEVRSFVIPDLKALADASTAAGHPLAIVAAYRSFQQQGDLLQQRITELGQVRAGRRVAMPGHSEHQLGTAIDFTSKGLPDVSPAWADSPTGQWMAQNSWQYGFVLSYPNKKMDVTCYRGEPWHFRYVGRRVAARVRTSGLTLRQYLWSLASQASPGP
jgi:zinc D-Ala-D-Ala carboxypeptidase